MNERKFLKKIASKENKTGSFTCTYINDFIDESNKLALVKPNLFARLFRSKAMSKSASDIIKDNFDFILQNTNDEYIGTLLETLIDNKELMEEKFKEILVRLNKNETSKLSANRFFTEFYDFSNEKNEFIENNIDLLFSSMDSDLLFEIKDKIKGISDKTDETINTELENNKTEIAKSILFNSIDFDVRKDIPKEEFDDYSKTLAIMMDELLQSENKKWIDIEKLNKGSYSVVYKIGDKILKVGDIRETYNIPNHSRILQPLIRTNFTQKNGNEDFACVEVSNCIDTYFSREEQRNTDKLYEVYKELREAGIIWTDVRWNNVGKLKQSNIQTLNNKKFNVNPNSVGFNKSIDGQQLEKGDIVILDTDYIYNENDKNIFIQPNGFAKQFEERYKKENKPLTKTYIKMAITNMQNNENRNSVVRALGKLNMMTEEETRALLKGKTTEDVKIILEKQLGKISKKENDFGDGGKNHPCQEDEDKLK